MSGAATNAGIDYQQRVASLLLVYQFGEIDIGSLFGTQRAGHIQEARFETDSPVDDVGIRCRENWGIDLQIKRSLSLSEDPDSEFSKVIHQFVRQYVSNASPDALYGLITTTDSSVKIRYDLRKAFESVRLNDSNFEQNPLNQSESNTLQTFRRVLDQAFQSIRGETPTEADFLAFCRRAFIAIFDVEHGMPLEHAALLILNQQGFSSPSLVWSLLIKNTLHYATERMSVSLDGLRSILDGFKSPANSNSARSATHDTWQQLDFDGIACGKEVLLIKSFSPEADFMIVELHRFDDQSNKRIKFKGSSVFLTKDQNIECEVIFRCASLAALDRFLEAEQDQFAKARVAVIPANNKEGIEESPAAKIHRARLQEMAKLNKTPNICLHCGKDVLDEHSFIVEVDEAALASAFGAIHEKCRRPLDRVIGRMEFSGTSDQSVPTGFDLSSWIKGLQRGQNLMKTVRAGLYPNDRSKVIAWSSDSEYDPDYRFCVRFVLADGSERFNFERGKILPVSKENADYLIKQLTAWIESQRRENDPICFTSIHGAFGPYSLLLQSKSSDEEVVEVVSAEVARYTKLLSALHDACENHYAPMALVREVETEAVLCLSNVVPLISDPLQFHKHEKNWKVADLVSEELSLEVIKDDRDFDKWMGTFFADGLVPVIDPIFDKNRNLVSGIVIQHQEAIFADMAMKKHGETGAGC